MKSQTRTETRILPAQKRFSVGQRICTETHLARCENTADFANNWLVAAQVGAPVKNEAEVIPEVVSLVWTPKFDREPYYPVMLGRAND